MGTLQYYMCVCVCVCVLELLKPLQNNVLLISIPIIHNKDEETSTTKHMNYKRSPQAMHDPVNDIRIWLLTHSKEFLICCRALATSPAKEFLLGVLEDPYTKEKHRQVTEVDISPLISINTMQVITEY